LLCPPFALVRLYSVASWPKFRPKSSKEIEENKSWLEEFMAEIWPNDTKGGRKGAEENLLKKFFILQQ
jgi:hypothetical protein